MDGQGEPGKGFAGGISDVENCEWQGLLRWEMVQAETSRSRKGHGSAHSWSKEHMETNRRRRGQMSFGLHASGRREPRDDSETKA